MKRLKNLSALFLVFIFLPTISFSQDKIQYEIATSVNSILGGGSPSILVKKRAKRFDRFWRYGLSGFSHRNDPGLENNYYYYNNYYAFAKNVDQVDEDFRNGGTGYETTNLNLSLGWEQRTMLGSKFQWYKGLGIGLNYSRFVTEGFRDVYTEGSYPDNYIVTSYNDYKNIRKTYTPSVSGLVGLEYTFNRNFKAFAETGVGFNYSHLIGNNSLEQNIWNYGTLTFDKEKKNGKTGVGQGFRVNLQPRVSLFIAYTFTRNKKKS
jgi:hypothetical protein